MTELFAHVGQWSVCRSGHGVVSAVLSVFARLTPWWKPDFASLESKMTSLTLLMKLFIVDASVLSNAQHPAFATVWSMYTSLLTDLKTTLAFKVKLYFIYWIISFYF